MILFISINDRSLGETIELLKVGQSRKQISKFSFEPKTHRKHFWISALASKMGQMKKQRPTIMLDDTSLISMTISHYLFEARADLFSLGFLFK